MKIPIHDFTKDNDGSVPFRFISLGASSHYDFSEPHRHNYYEIFFFNEGGGTHFIDFTEYPITDNAIHFVSPGQVHRLQRSGHAHGSIVLFSRDFFHPVAGNSGSLFSFPFLNNSPYPVMNVTKEEFDEFAPLLSLIANEKEKGREVYKEFLRSCLNATLLKCLHLFNTVYPDRASKQGSAFNVFRELVEKEYRGQRQPSWYASQLHITEKRLNEMCKDATGENVTNYIKQRIMLEAKRLLAHTDHSVKEIATFLGFDDPAYFNRFYKTNAGETAGDFRKNGN